MSAVFCRQHRVDEHLPLGETMYRMRQAESLLLGYFKLGRSQFTKDCPAWNKPPNIMHRTILSTHQGKTGQFPGDCASGKY